MRPQRIWMMSTKEAFAQYSIDRLQHDAKRLKIELAVYRPDELSFMLDQDKSVQVFGTNREPLELPDAFFMKMGCSTITFKGLALMRALEQFSATRVTNPSRCYETLGNKWQSYISALGANVPMPRTILLQHASDLELALDTLGLPLVLKDATGARGEGVALIESARTARELLRLILNQPAPHRQFVAQEYLGSSHGRDVRVLVIGGQAVGAVVRQAKDGGFRANVSQGADVTATQITAEMRTIVGACCEQFGLKLGGIDLLYTQQGYSLCEVNLGAQFVGFEKASGQNVAEQILKSL